MAGQCTGVGSILPNHNVATQALRWVTPRYDILHGTNIKHIEVSCLFDLCNSATAAFTQEPIQLESISTDHVTPILYLLKSPNHRRSPQWIFARLTKLTMTILNDDAVTKMMSIISCAPVLDTLAVESFCGISTSRPLTWTQMATFRHLRIFDKGLTPQSFEPKGGQCAATRVLDVAEDPPQTLKTLSLEFALKFMIHPRYGCPTKLQHHDYAPIDEVLARTANTRYRNVEQLYICGIGQLGPIPGGFDLVTFKGVGGAVSFLHPHCQLMS
ncbi:unnamed protein product [Cyclocybe aegerita]|uniref:Uncharacterized protein n=1 Tax=Cyclocybe aegerita TaxID=1973307 RepID=A0A8S0XY76_CYCAE|nr:unnamed protein product [Cyclocybe aegerita]